MSVRPCLLDQLHYIHPLGVIDHNMVMDCSTGSYFCHPDIFQVYFRLAELLSQLCEELSSQCVGLFCCLRSPVLCIGQCDVEITFSEVRHDQPLNFSPLIPLILSFYLFRCPFSFPLPRTSGSSIIPWDIFLNLFNLSEVISDFCVQDNLLWVT